MRKVLSKPDSRYDYWRVFFAWKPVQVEAKDGSYYLCWLERVERRLTNGYGGPSWRYREI